MSKTLAYCDYNAGAPVRPEAAAAVARALEVGGNPSSVHSAGRRVRTMIEDARDTLGAVVGARADNVIFTSGATEALHLAMTSALPDRASSDAQQDAGLKARGPSLIVGATEHDAVFEHAAKATNASRVAPVDANGVIDPEALEKLLTGAPKPALVCIQLANNETGVIQPIAKIAALVRTYGALLLVDAAQAFCRITVDIAALDATYLVVSSHKIGGPPGAGALILAPGAPFTIGRFGGGQERGRRPGTENAAAIAGFGAAVVVATRDLKAEAKRVAALRDRFEAGLPKNTTVFAASWTAGVPAGGGASNDRSAVVGIKTNGGDAGGPRLPNTSNFALPGIIAETAVIAMDLEGVCVSSGAACSSGKVRSSRVLAAMGVTPELAKSALRVSFGWNSTDADVDACLAALNKIAARRALAGAA
jgi:cysteine desulfurase